MSGHALGRSVFFDRQGGAAEDAKLDRPRPLGSGKVPKERRFLRKRELIVIVVHYMDPRRQSTPEGMVCGPNGVRLEWIMISRQEKYRAVLPVTPLEELK
jgi:hypothetical protein